MISIAKYYHGFGLIETLVAILLTAIISSTFFLGITQAKLYLESIRVKQTAFRELTNWTNQWKSMIAAGAVSFPDDPSGEPVVLKRDSRGNTTLEGRMHKKIRIGTGSGELSTYYNIQTYVTWSKRRFFQNMAIEADQDTLYLNAYQIKFNTKTQ